VRFLGHADIGVVIQLFDHHGHEAVEEYRLSPADGQQKRDDIRDLRREGSYDDTAVRHLVGGNRIHQADARPGNHELANGQGQLRLDTADQGDACQGVSFNGALADAVLHAQGDKRLAAQRLGAQNRFLGQPVLGGQHRHQRRLEKGHLLHPGGDRLKCGKADVDLLRADPFADLGRASDLHRHIDAGVFRRKGRDRPRQEAQGDGRQRGDLQEAGAKVANLLGRRGDLVETCEGALNLLEERQGFHRGHDPPLAPHEKRKADSLLQVPDEARDSGLGDAHEVRGAGDGAGLHHRMEGFHLTQAETPRARQAAPPPGC